MPADVISIFVRIRPKKISVIPIVSVFLTVRPFQKYTS